VSTLLVAGPLPMPNGTTKATAGMNCRVADDAMGAAWLPHRGCHDTGRCRRYEVRMCSSATPHQGVEASLRVVQVHGELLHGISKPLPGEQVCECPPIPCLCPCTACPVRSTLLHLRQQLLHVPLAVSIASPPATTPQHKGFTQAA